MGGGMQRAFAATKGHIIGADGKTCLRECGMDLRKAAEAECDGMRPEAAWDGKRDSPGEPDAWEGHSASCDLRHGDPECTCKAPDSGGGGDD